MLCCFAFLLCCCCVALSFSGVIVHVVPAQLQLGQHEAYNVLPRMSTSSRLRRKFLSNRCVLFVRSNTELLAEHFIHVSLRNIQQIYIEIHVRSTLAVLEVGRKERRQLRQTRHI